MKTATKLGEVLMKTGTKLGEGLMRTGKKLGHVLVTKGTKLVDREPRAFNHVNRDKEFFNLTSPDPPRGQ